MKREQLRKGLTESLKQWRGTLDSQAQAASIRLQGEIQRACAGGSRVDQKVHLYAIGRIFLHLLKGHDAYALPNAVDLESAERDPSGKPEAEPDEDRYPPEWE